MYWDMHMHSFESLSSYSWLSCTWIRADSSRTLMSRLLLLLINVHEVISRETVWTIKYASVYQQTCKRMEVSSVTWVNELRRHTVKLWLHKVVCKMVTRRMVSGLSTWIHHPTSCRALNFLWPILSIAWTSSKITLIQKFICSWANGPTIYRLVELWSKLLLRCSAWPHLHILYLLTVVLPVLSAAHATVSWWCELSWMREVLMLIVTWGPLWVSLSRFLRFAVLNHRNVIILNTKQAKRSSLNFSAWIKQRRGIGDGKVK